jgi:uncharacterized glyoxalase superfamily protein PhnB
MSVFESTVYYREPKRALVWLAGAFGFEPTLLIEGSGDDERQMHAEMKFGGSQISVGGEYSDRSRSPISVGGVNTQSLQVRLESDIDSHCERARAAGAVIIQEPKDEFWGDRRYRAVDIEGHVWSFVQQVRAVSRVEAERILGQPLPHWQNP